LFISLSAVIREGIARRGFYIVLDERRFDLRRAGREPICRGIRARSKIFAEARLVADIFENTITFGPGSSRPVRERVAISAAS
jgi:hypothetical protein